MKPNMKLQDIVNMPEGIDWMIDNQWDYELTTLFWKRTYEIDEVEHIFIAQHPDQPLVIFENPENEYITLTLGEALEIHKENYGWV